MQLLKKIQETIKKYSMLSEGDRVLIGLSGGPDSVCLAIILDKFGEDFNLSLNAVYVDHGLRPDEVKHERSFCKTFCDSLGITFFSKSVDVKGYAKKKRLNQQEAARALRYQVYEEISREVNATKIALAHSADDQAETFLMRILRGSGLKGLSGIPPVRGKIIRPLIETAKKEIEDFLHQNSLLVPPYSSLPFIVDSSNLKIDYFRNWIRQKIIPELKKQNPALIKTIGRVADILREEDTYLDSIVTKTLMKLISRRRDDTVELFLFPLENMGKPILRRVLRRAINETKGLRGIGFIHIEEIIKLVKRGKSGNILNLPKGIRAVKGYSTLLLTVKTPLKLKSRAFNPPGELALEEAGIVLKAEVSENWDNKFNGKDTAVFDFERLIFPLEVRMRQKGDYFYPSGFGRRKKLQDFFVDNKIPRDERDNIPIMVSGKEIIWVVGHRMDERFKATDKTEKFLRLIISRGKS
jgi:tRNA(Ile)-lysidine synthase